jgi:hypothetical protein
MIISANSQTNSADYLLGRNAKLKSFSAGVFVDSREHFMTVSLHSGLSL